MKDSGAVIRMAVSCTCRDGGFQKNFEIFSENRGQNTTCLAITPIEGHLVADPGKTTFFQKNPNIRSGSFLKKVEKRVNDSGFFAYVIGDGHEKSKDFRKKLGFLLSVCRKNLNILNEQTARKDQLPAKRKEEWMQQRWA